MPYEEESFLDGLAKGMTATVGRRTAENRKVLLTGISRMTGVLPEGEFDAFVSRVYIQTDSPVTIVYEYGPADAETLTKDFRNVGASEETQILHHVVRPAGAYSLRAFRYDAYLLERDGMQIRFDARFMSFPYSDDGTAREYPGSPEQVTVWWTRTTR